MTYALEENGWRRRRTEQDLEAAASETMRAHYAAACRGEPAAARTLGDGYAFGTQGLARDYAMARYWYERAAAAGDADAMAALGGMHAHGQGHPVDGERAVYWLSKGSDCGNASAMTALAYLLRRGIFVKRDTSRAASLYAEALRRDPSSDSCAYDLASCYERGEGVPQDPHQALALYQHAAALGSGLARKALARLGAA